MRKFKNIGLTARRVAARLLNEASERPATKFEGYHDPLYLAKVFPLLQEAGIPEVTTELTPQQQMVHWTGKTLAVGGAGADIILHELAHFQVAPPAWRFRPEFGISPGPDAGYHSDVDTTYPDVAARPMSTRVQDNWWMRNIDILEECRASLLGIFWERHLGGRFYQNLNSHSWVNPRTHPLEWDGEDTPGHIKWLLEQGLINGVGTPQLKLRMNDDEAGFSPVSS